MKTEILRSITEQFSETNLNNITFLRITVLPLIIIFIVQKKLEYHKDTLTFHAIKRRNYFKSLYIPKTNSQ